MLVVGDEEEVVLVGGDDEPLEKAKSCKRESLLMLDEVDIEEVDVLDRFGVRAGVVTADLPFFEVEGGEDFTGLEEGVVGGESPESSWHSSSSLFNSSDDSFSDSDSMFL